MYHDQVLGEIDADTSNLVYDFPLLRWIASTNHRGIPTPRDGESPF